MFFEKMHAEILLEKHLIDFLGLRSGTTKLYLGKYLIDVKMMS